MTTDTIERKVRELRAADRAAAKISRAERDRELRARAARELQAEELLAAKLEKARKADVVERELRAHHEPRVDVHVGDGKIITITLAGADGNTRAIAVEAVRRASYEATGAWTERLVASRHAGA